MVRRCVPVLSCDPIACGAAIDQPGGINVAGFVKKVGSRHLCFYKGVFAGSTYLTTNAYQCGCVKSSAFNRPGIVYAPCIPDR